MSDTIEKGLVVGIVYSLTGEDGDLIDESGDEEFFYLHGAENIVPGLEDALDGKAVGDELTVDVEPEDGYGEREGPGPQRVERDAFPDDAELEIGMPFLAENDEGEVMELWITGLEEDGVFIDHNHPLAGKKLHFEVTVKSLRPATEEELEHGHPHGPDGHHHH
ncbi:MAG: peptidylprolyl isomerase [Deltaproteobacteria bacterium]|nr:peptidylprolyl isomerase [Deltaproteobacteria bacterium]